MSSHSRLIEWLWLKTEHARSAGDELAADWWGDWWWAEALKAVRQVHAPDFWNTGRAAHRFHIVSYSRAEVLQ
jgi:hypothetical protein